LHFFAIESARPKADVLRIPQIAQRKTFSEVSLFNTTTARWRARFPQEEQRLATGEQGNGPITVFRALCLSKPVILSMMRALIWNVFKDFL
jgi:hypothetical protein